MTKCAFRAAVLGMFLCLESVSYAQDNGIFADFQTSMGSFTCRLDYVTAPKTVANFIGLATGQRGWIDAASGRIRSEPYYNGLTFHRVIAGFMIQGGSPNGQGTDGPGYVFPDEFSPTSLHDGPGVLSMANNGPNANGAQYFITVAATPWLNGVHTVFGRVATGQNVVQAISQVAVDANSKPRTNVVVQSVTIRRVGAEAQAFNVQAQQLPVVTNASVSIQQALDGKLTLAYSNRLHVETRIRSSTNLFNWTQQKIGIDITAPYVDRVTVLPSDPKEFFSVVQVQYPSSTWAPRTLDGRKLILDFDQAIGNLTNVFNANGGGSYQVGASAGTITSYTWQQDVYRAYLWPIYFSGLSPMTFQLNFKSDTSGQFSGKIYSTMTTNVSGSFTLSAPAQ